MVPNLWNGVPRKWNSFSINETGIGTGALLYKLPRKSRWACDFQVWNSFPFLIAFCTAPCRQTIMSNNSWVFWISGLQCMTCSFCSGDLVMVPRSVVIQVSFRSPRRGLFIIVLVRILVAVSHLRCSVSKYVEQWPTFNACFTRRETTSQF